MEGINLSSTFAEFKELKNIDRPTMMWHTHSFNL